MVLFIRAHLEEGLLLKLILTWEKYCKDYLSISLIPEESLLSRQALSQ